MPIVLPAAGPPTSPPPGTRPTVTHLPSLPRRRLLALAVALVPLVALLAVGAVPERSVDAVGRAVVVSKTTGLQSGEVVTVSWEGFTPRAPVYLHQCVRDSTLWRDCAEPTRVEAVSDAEGRGSTTFPIWGGEIPRPAGVVGANGPISCAGGQCMLVVSECGFDLFAERTVTTPIRLAASDGGTNPATTTTSSSSTTSTSLEVPGELVEPSITAAADSDSQLLTEEWQFGVLAEPNRFDLDITTINAPSAIEGFTGNDITSWQSLYDIAFTNLPMSAEQAAKMAEVGRGFTYVPVALNGLVLGYDFKVNGIEVRNLDLTPQTLALIYTGQIASWNNPAITADMGGCKFSNTNAGSAYPVPGFRTDRSGANWWFNSWLAARAPTEWAPVLAISGGIDVNLGINDSKVIGETGAERLADFVELGRPGQSGGDNDRLNAPIAGRFGFYDRSLARARGTQLMRLPNAAGEMVSPSDTAILEGFEAAARGADGTWVPDFTTPTPGAYPLPLVTYALVPTTISGSFTPDKGKVLRGLLTWAVSDEGQTLAEELGYVRLPDELQTAALEEIAKIPTEEPPPTTTTTTTVVESTTTTAPAPTFGDELAGGFGTTPLGDPGGFGTTSFDSSSTSSGGFSSSSASSSGAAGGFVDAGTPSADSGGDVAADAAATEPDADEQDLVAFVVGTGGRVPTVTLMLLLGLGALAAGPALRMRARGADR